MGSLDDNPSLADPASAPIESPPVDLSTDLAGQPPRCPAISFVLAASSPACVCGRPPISCRQVPCLQTALLRSSSSGARLRVERAVRGSTGSMLRVANTKRKRLHCLKEPQVYLREQ